MKPSGSLVFIVGSLSWALAQWFLVWLFARFAGGAAAVGEYSLALAITTPIFTFGHFGLRTIYLTLRTRHAWSLYVRLRFIGIVIAAAIVLGYLLVETTGDPWIWGALIFQKSIDAYLDLVYGRIQRNNRLTQIGVLGLAKTVGTMVVAAVVILVTGSVSLAVFGSGVVSLLVVFFAHRVAFDLREVNLHTARSAAGYRNILRAAFPITITEGLASISNYLPLLFLGIIADSATAGVFAAASYLFSAAHIIGGILRNVLITSLRMTFEHGGTKQLLRRAHRIVGALGLLGLLIVPVVIFAGSPVLEFIYGEGFEFNFKELTLLAFAVLSITPAYIYSALLNIINRYDSQAWSLFGSLIFGSVVGVVLLLSNATSALIVALGVALAANWGRLVGVLLLTLSVKTRGN